MNLWEETIEKLQENGYIFDDVIAIYGEDFQITKENFEEIAKETDYNDGYGCQEIAKDLTILGKDFIMIRENYDGAEWWRMILIPDVSSSNKNIKYVNSLIINSIFKTTLNDINFGRK